MMRPSMSPSVMTGPSVGVELTSVSLWEDAFLRCGLGQPGLFLTEAGDFKMRFFAAKLHSALILGGETSIPFIIHTETIPGPCITFQASAWPHDPPLRNTTSFGALTLRLPGLEHFFSVSGGGKWGAILLSADLLQQTAMRSLGRRVDMSNVVPRLLTPDLQVFRDIVQFHTEVADTVFSRPESLAERGLSDLLAARTAELFVRSSALELFDGDNSVPARHAQVLTRLRAAVEEHPSEPLQIADLCNMLSISSRTLHAICQQHFGIGPKRYITMRRLELARAALREASPDMSVTSIALKSGFWELGRFAGAYKLAFGESPSETLRRPL